MIMITWENTSANAVIKRCPGNFSFSTIPSLPVLAFCTAFELSVSLIVRSLSAKKGPDRYRSDKNTKFGTELL